MADRAGPYDRPPRARLDDGARRELLGRAFRGVERGAHDDRVVAWLAGQDPAAVRSVAGMVERAAAALRSQLAGRGPRPSGRRGGAGGAGL